MTTVPPLVYVTMSPTLKLCAALAVRVSPAAEPAGGVDVSTVTALLVELAVTSPRMMS